MRESPVLPVTQPAVLLLSNRGLRLIFRPTDSHLRGARLGRAPYERIMPMKSMIVLMALCAVLIPVVPTVADTSVLRQQAQSFQKEIKVTVKCKYLLYLPKDYEVNKDQKWPLVMFLHGSGAKGDDIESVKQNGLPMEIAMGKDFPFIVVSPQCPERGGWNTDMLFALLDTLAKDYRVDKDRVILTGLSMGGFATWEMAIQQPKMFAAIVPVCGGAAPKYAPLIKDIPTWVFHGAKDGTVPVKRSQEMVDAMKAAGGNPKFTIYPETEHDSWVQAYKTPELYEWMMQQKRGK